VKRKIVYGLILIGVIVALSCILVFYKNLKPSEPVEEWVHYVPSAGQVELDKVELYYWKENAVAYAVPQVIISITFTHGGYNVSDWGTPTAVGVSNQLSVNAEIWEWTGGSIAVIITKHHIYNLGILKPGEYTFTFKVWDTPVKNITFTVPE